MNGLTNNTIPSKPRVRKHLSADALLRTIRRKFEKVPDPRSGRCEIPIADALMAAFAMFSLKDPSLLAFQERWNTESNNLRSIYGIKRIPSDTQMRDILDLVPPKDLANAYLAVFHNLQRGKALDSMVFMDGCHLMAMDGTGYFSSEKLFSPFCLRKTSHGKTVYSLQMLGAALVHPDRKEVIPFMPEIIRREDGETKNDCERNAAKRFCRKLRSEHPHLSIIVTEDALSPNAPHIEELRSNGFHFILGVKPGDHKHLFQQMEEAQDNGLGVSFHVQDEKDGELAHFFRFANDLALSKSHAETRVNLLEYWEVRGDQIKPASWVTDFLVTRENAYLIMRGARARWRIENETFNTLKNQGYHLEHNYGLGQEHLSMVFVTLMMLAFLVDQTQQLCCGLFQSVWKKLGTKRALWEAMRALFSNFLLDSMEMLYLALLYGHKRERPIILYDSS
jgi:hypothetical protein